ncbi:MAG: ABC transporter ATP-binding protein/permease [Flavobacteriales bacterium]|nr:ABC transporter ATP-binding protein/permease [Flavobacteriales bacterium]
MGKFRRMIKYLVPYRMQIAGFGLLTVLSILLSVVSVTLAIPFLQILFDRVQAPQQMPDFTFTVKGLMQTLYYWMGKSMGGIEKSSMLALICTGMVLLFFLKNLTVYLSLHVLAPMRTGVIYDLRKKMYDRILELPLSYFSEQKKGDIMTRMSADVVEIEWSIMNSLISLMRDPLLIIAYLVMMFIFSPQLTLFAFILLPVSAFIIARIGRSLKRASFSGQKILSDLMIIIEETLGGMRIVKAFQAEDLLRKKFHQQNDQFKVLGNSIFRKRSLSSPLSEFLGSIVIAVIMWFGGKLVLDVKLDPEVFITYIAMFSQVISPAKAVSSTFYNLQKGIASIDRIEEILNAENTLKEHPDPISLKSFEHSIELKQVVFSYTNQPVLNNVSLVIPKGKTIALVGASGAGKSTMADLIARYYDVTGGNILIDGHDVKQIKITDLRNLMSIVSQQPILFNDTVAANITFGDPSPNMERMKLAAKLAYAADFIEALPNGYFSSIGDQGNKLSGGQRQRIAIARALYKDAPILILDEATSALDAESEKIVQQAIQNLTKNRTVIVIAHRLSTIQHADEIIVLDRGEIIERGTHAELVKMNGAYKRMVELNTF